MDLQMLLHSSFDSLMFGMYHVQVNILYGHLRTYLKLEQPAPISQPLLFANFAINIAEEHGLCGQRQILRCSGGTLNRSYHPDVNNMAITTVGLI